MKIATASGQCSQALASRGCQQKGGQKGVSSTPASARRPCKRHCSVQAAPPLGSLAIKARNAASISAVTSKWARFARLSWRLLTGIGAIPYFAAPRIVELPKPAALSRRAACSSAPRGRAHMPPKPLGHLPWKDGRVHRLQCPLPADHQKSQNRSQDRWTIAQGWLMRAALRFVSEPALAAVPIVSGARCTRAFRHVYTIKS